jgi:phosphoribosylformimino-5-aminoimidazole carboxamide ribotide isomerase
MGALYNPPPVMNSQTKTLRFEAIPVMDLMGGQVVRARGGARHDYRPIASPLCATSDPMEVVRGLLELYPFDTLYIADLDAIQQRGSHLQTLASLRAVFPSMEIWVDAGFTSFAQYEPLQSLGMRCVIGSESLPDADAARRLIEQLGQQQAILSLDFADGSPKGPAALFEDATRWPGQVIAMTLARVGSYEGPDIDLLRCLQARADGRKIYAAGGVRDFADLQALQEIGIAGALLASALHDERITAAQFTRLAK